MRGAGREYEWELMPLALDQGIGTLVWSPFSPSCNGARRAGAALRSRLTDLFIE
jgi:aryl-alcohol dehydrogenase-like predicted oxidoreductase